MDVEVEDRKGRKEIIRYGSILPQNVASALQFLVFVNKDIKGHDLPGKFLRREAQDKLSFGRLVVSEKRTESVPPPLLFHAQKKTRAKGGKALFWPLIILLGNMRLELG
jgi:hypothetical protein